MHSLLLLMYMETFRIPNKGEAATWEKASRTQNTEAQASTPSASSQEAEHNNEHTYNCIRQTQVSGTQRFACWGCSCWCMGRLRARGEREWNWLEIEANWTANEWYQDKLIIARCGTIESNSEGWCGTCKIEARQGYTMLEPNMNHWWSGRSHHQWH